MKFKYFMPAALAIIPMLAAARPAYPHPMKVTNADGTSVEIIRHGDEHFDFVTDSDKRYILEKNSEGNWKPAVRNGLKLSYDANNIALLRSEVKQCIPVNDTFDPYFMAPLDSDGRTLYPTNSGDVHSLVVLIEYADTPFSIPDPQKTFSDQLNQEGYSGYGAHGSAADYYKAQSSGKFRPIFDVSPVVKLSHGKAYYSGVGTSYPGAGKNACFGFAIEEALTYLDGLGYDFSKYDYDEDGDIDTVYFFYSGYGQANSPDTESVWPHQADFKRFTIAGSPGQKPLYLDGKRVGPYACSNELIYSLPMGAKAPYLEGIGAFCHEFGHVLGLPDLYDTTDAGCKSPGTWDLMDQGSYNMNSTCPPNFSAWERWVLNWMEFDELEEGSTNSMKGLGASENNPKAYRLRILRPASTKYYNEFFVFETRSRDGYDISLPNEGMLIWRINYNKSVWTSNTVNTTRPNVEILYSDPTSRCCTWPDDFGDVVSSYPGAPNQLKPYSSNPKFLPYITRIGYDYDTKTASFEYNVITEKPTVATTMHNVEIVDENKRTIKLSWDPVEGAEGYLLTIKLNDDTKDVYLNSYDEYNVGNTTSVTLKNVSQSNWAKEYTSYVRVVDRVPSSKVSNEVTFCPANGNSGVEDIFDGTIGDIRGGIGCIIAPEDARIFNVGGFETSKDNLPAGVYIVKLGNRTSKVIVR